VNCWVAQQQESGGEVCMTGRDDEDHSLLGIGLLLSFQAPLAGHCATGQHVVHGGAAALPLTRLSECEVAESCFAVCSVLMWSLVQKVEEHWCSVGCTLLCLLEVWVSGVRRRVVQPLGISYVNLPC
jgi:hypothetical protein